MDNYQDIFNLNNDDFIEKETSKESDFYKPDPKRGKDNVYKSLIRFVPFHKDPKKSKVKKYHYWLVDPLTGDGISVDCPSTVNQKSVIQDTFWKLKKSQSVAEQKLSDKFKRREVYFALVQILKDDHDPSLVGKIKVLKFGQKLNAILQSELQPEYGKPYNPFDPFGGRVMALTVTILAGFNNYDTSKFVGEETPLLLDGKPIKKDKQDMARFLEFLEQNSPDLTKYEYKEWSDETREKVKSIIENTVPTMRMVEGVTKQSTSTTISTGKPAAPKVQEKPKEQEISLDDLQLDSVEDGDFDEDIYSNL